MGYVYQSDIENTNMTHFSWSKFIPKINVDNNSNIWRAYAFTLSLARSLFALSLHWANVIQENYILMQLIWIYANNEVLIFSSLQWMHSLLAITKKYSAHSICKHNNNEREMKKTHIELWEHFSNCSIVVSLRMHKFSMMVAIRYASLRRRNNQRNCHCWIFACKK